MKNNIKTTIVSVITTIIVVTAAFWVHPSRNQVVVTDQQPQAPVVERGNGPEVSSPYMNINGVQQWYFHQEMKQGTTTVCSFAYPPVGTSTLEYVTFGIRSATTSDLAFEVGTSTTPFATTSPALVTNYPISAGSVGSNMWTVGSSTTNKPPLGTGFTSGTTTATTTYVNIFAMGTQNNAGGYFLNGACNAVFDQHL